MAFARFLADRSQGKRHRFTGVHVVELGMLPMPDPPSIEAIVGAAKDVGQATLEAHHVQDVIQPLEVVVGEAADSTLAAVAARPGCDGLIVGRAAASDSKQLVRLGRVARRLLRKLPVPVVVTPPDLDVASVGAGPILLATDGHEHSVGAARVARALAESLGRELVIATSIGLTPPSGYGYMTPEAWDSLHRRIAAEHRDRLVAWIRRNGLDAHRVCVVEGFTVSELLRLITSECACMIVCGSRRASTVERLFSSSVGIALAGESPVPVAVVPPDWPR